MDLFTISFRNVVYNKTRTIRTFLILSFGALIYVFISALLGGMQDLSLKGSIEEETADIRIRALNYDEDIPYSDTNFFIANESGLKKVDGIKYTERIFVKGDLDNYQNSLPIVVIGIDPEKDSSIFSIPSTSSNAPSEGGIWVGASLAEQMGVKEDDYVNVSFRSYNGVYVSSEYQITGITKSSIPLYSEQAILIDINEMKNLFSTNMTSQYSVKVENEKDFDRVVKELKELYPNNQVITWKELLSDLFANIQIRRIITNIFLGMIMVVALLGLANAILISAWEKRKITAMMRAMGFFDRDIVGIFILEGFWIAMIGAIVGVILGIIINIPMSLYGINFGDFMKQSGQSFDVGFYIPPVLKSNWDIINFIPPLIIMPLLAVIISYFPARRSVKMSIVDAIRTRN